MTLPEDPTDGTEQNSWDHGTPWSEDEYQEYLQSERRSFAWVLHAYGSIDLAEAVEEAEKRYPYEPPDTPYRGLVFHDSSWHWAMIHLYGQGYWWTRPELSEPPQEYRKEGLRCQSLE